MIFIVLSLVTYVALAVQVKSQGYCLEPKKLIRSEAAMSKCREGSARQQWSYDAGTGRIKADTGGMCLGALLSNRPGAIKVETMNCGSDHKTKWSYNRWSKELKFQGSNHCLFSRIQQKKKPEVALFACDYKSARGWIKDWSIYPGTESDTSDAASAFNVKIFSVDHAILAFAVLGFISTMYVALRVCVNAVMKKDFKPIPETQEEI